MPCSVFAMFACTASWSTCDRACPSCPSCPRPPAPLSALARARRRGRRTAAARRGRSAGRCGLKLLLKTGFGPRAAVARRARLDRGRAPHRAAARRGTLHPRRDERRTRRGGAALSVGATGATGARNAARSAGCDSSSASALGRRQLLEQLARAAPRATASAATGSGSAAGALELDIATRSAPSSRSAWRCASTCATSAAVRRRLLGFDASATGAGARRAPPRPSSRRRLLRRRLPRRCFALLPLPADAHRGRPGRPRAQSGCARRCSFLEHRRAAARRRRRTPPRDRALEVLTTHSSITGPHGPAFTTPSASDAITYTDRRHRRPAQPRADLGGARSRRSPRRHLRRAPAGPPCPRARGLASLATTTHAALARLASPCEPRPRRRSTIRARTPEARARPRSRPGHADGRARPPLVFGGQLLPGTPSADRRAPASCPASLREVLALEIEDVVQRAGSRRSSRTATSSGDRPLSSAERHLASAVSSSGGSGANSGPSPPRSSHSRLE